MLFRPLERSTFHPSGRLDVFFRNYSEGGGALKSITFRRDGEKTISVARSQPGKRVPRDKGARTERSRRERGTQSFRDPGPLEMDSVLDVQDVISKETRGSEADDEREGLRDYARSLRAILLALTRCPAKGKDNLTEQGLQCCPSGHCARRCPCPLVIR